jgi:hypothetical protein
MDQISIFREFSICRRITPDGEFDLSIWTVDTKIFYHKIIRADEWIRAVPDFTMEQMLKIINVCVEGDYAYIMNLSRTESGNCLYMNFVLKERIKTYTFTICVPREEISELNNIKLLLHDLKKDLHNVIGSQNQIGTPEKDVHEKINDLDRSIAVLREEVDEKINNLDKSIDDRINASSQALIDLVKKMFLSYEKLIDDREKIFDEKNNALFGVIVDHRLKQRTA